MGARLRPFRFGVQCSAALPGPEWRDLARRIEGLGYDTMTVADHLDDQHAIVPALMAAADATTTLRVGALVLCNDYHHPVVLAKELATIDVLSGGRVEVGVGAGWMTTDYVSAGLTLDSAGVRIARLAEALDVIDGLWGPGPFSYEGSHYRIAGLDGRPKPLQSPRPPLLLGGGARRMLTLAGQRADIVGINVSLAKGVIDADAGSNGTVAATDEKVGWVREAAAAAGREVPELQVRVHLVLPADDRVAASEAFAPAFGISPEESLQTPHALVGTTDDIVEDLLARRERWGINYIGVSLDALDAMAPVVARLAGR